MILGVDVTKPKFNVFIFFLFEGRKIKFLPLVLFLNALSGQLWTRSKLGTKLNQYFPLGRQGFVT